MATETTTTEVTEFEDGSKIVETKTVESEYIEGDNPSPMVELEPYVEPSVEIAQIEADRDITIAAIEADARTAEVEALAEMSAPSEDDEWRRNIEANLAETNSRLAELAALLTPPLSTPPEPSPPMNNPESGEDGPPAVAVAVEVEQAEPAPEPPKRARKSRWI